jgi:hypothetical protein
MELGSYFLFLQEQIKDIIIKHLPQAHQRDQIVDAAKVAQGIPLLSVQVSFRSDGTQPAARSRARFAHRIVEELSRALRAYARKVDCGGLTDHRDQAVQAMWHLLLHRQFPRPCHCWHSRSCAAVLCG